MPRSEPPLRPRPRRKAGRRLTPARPRFSMNAPRVIVTCEHASPRIPESCRADLVPYAAEQETHRLYDWGAAEVARPLARAFKAPLFLGDVCRLAIDLNRSLDSPELHAPPIRDGEPSRRARLAETRYKPFRAAALAAASEGVAQCGRILHLSVHTFTPVLDGARRSVDIGILFDPDRAEENRLGLAWIEALRTARPDLRIHANQPYEGKADGHTTALRAQYPDAQYSGVEIELSQALPLRRDARAWAALLAETLRSCLRA